MRREILAHFNGRKNKKAHPETEDQLSADLTDYNKIWEGAGIETRHFCPDVDRAWHCVRNKLKENQSGLNYRWYWIAAGILLFLTSIFVFQFKGTFDSSIQTQTVAVGEAAKEFQLADGSKVWVKSGGSIQYDENEPRKVILQGEAFFQVADDKESPFVVSAGPVETVVLGTEFNIASEVETVRIDVVSGRVAINALDRTVEIGQNDRVEVNVKENRLIRSKIDHQNFLFWKTGVLEFNDESLEEITSEISRAYRAEIEIPAQLSACKLTVTFDNLTIDDSLEVLARLLNGSFEKEGSGFIISSGQCL